MLLALLIVTLLNAALVIFLVVRMKSPQGASDERFAALEKNLERMERIVREDLSRSRDELSQNLSRFSDTLAKQIALLTQTNEQKLETVRESVERRLEYLQKDNSAKLEEMRATVDEKLHATLERRLGESFKIVSERLEKVHQGLGEMQNLAVGVGDLKKVLSNVKTRGILGEVQLENLLEQILTPDQYEKQIPTKKGSRDPVEFAVKLPGRGDDLVYLPIDAKFPLEDYERLQNAQEQGQMEAIVEMGKALEARIKLEAKNIREKYLDPPHTTDFAVLFLPTEGLYAEVLRRPGLFDLLRRDYRVAIAGPTTIAAILNSLQLGFRTLAVQKRASEVWLLLGTVKSEFGKFADILKKTGDKLKEASTTIEDAERKTRTIERKLRDVQELPGGSVDLLPPSAESLTGESNINVRID